MHSYYENQAIQFVACSKITVDSKGLFQSRKKNRGKVGRKEGRVRRGGGGGEDMEFPIVLKK